MCVHCIALPLVFNLVLNLCDLLSDFDEGEYFLDHLANAVISQNQYKCINVKYLWKAVYSFLFFVSYSLWTVLNVFFISRGTVCCWIFGGIAHLKT